MSRALGDVELLAESFNGRMHDILDLLHEQDARGEEFRFLTFRLDFNHYFERQKTARQLAADEAAAVDVDGDEYDGAAGETRPGDGAGYAGGARGSKGRGGAFARDAATGIGVEAMRLSLSQGVGER